MIELTPLEKRGLAAFEGWDAYDAKHRDKNTPGIIDMRLLPPVKPMDFSNTRGVLRELKGIEQEDLESERNGAFFRIKIIGGIAVAEAYIAREKGEEYPVKIYDEHVEPINGFRPEPSPEEEKENLIDEINETLQHLERGLRYDGEHAERLLEILAIPDRVEIKQLLERTAKWGRAALSYLPIPGELVEPEIEPFEDEEWTGYYTCEQYNDPHMYFNIADHVTYTFGRSADLPAHEYIHAAEGVIKQKRIEDGLMSPLGGIVTYGDQQNTQLEANAQLGSRMAMSNEIKSFPRGKHSLEETELLFKLYGLTGRATDMALHDAIYRANSTRNTEAAIREFKQRAPLETEDKIRKTVVSGTEDPRLMAYLLSYYQVLQHIVDPVFRAGEEKQKQFMTESTAHLLTPAELDERAHSFGLND